MVNFFDRLYSKITNKNKHLQKIRFYSFQRFLIRKAANITLPLYFILTAQNRKHRLSDLRNHKKKVVVSLTSFPARINKLWLVVETILRQTYKPDMIILWLSKEQFSSIDSLPKRLLKQRGRGLSIELVTDDLRSHKKYFYSFQRYPNDIIITLDDDIFYNSKIIEYLVLTNKKYPDCIVCNFASIIRHKNQEILPYNEWNVIDEKFGPTKKLIPIGAGGILYPPNSMYKDVLNDTLFKKYCFFADDIWLNIMSRLNNTLIVKTDYFSYYLPVLYKFNTKLTTLNVLQGLNNEQLQKTRNYYISNHNVDPFFDLLHE
jgi:hypothetical protein